MLLATAPEQLINLMTLEEQVSLLSGEDFWSFPAIPRLGIGKMRVTDGPNGARGSGSLVGGISAACFPAGISLGASWNPDLVEAIGAAIAQEVKSKGAHVSLAPTVNIQRSCTNGRNFECYSEDPELSAALASAFIKGQQKRGVASTVKHFAGNESEIERTTISSEIDERTLREIYLRPFEDAVKKAGSWSMMSSYNKLNGIYTAESQWLLTQVLRNEWGFDGAVMSDWFGSRSTAPTINAGLDMEMPGPSRDRGTTLLKAVERGEVDSNQVRQLALNVLRLMQRVGSLNDHRPFLEQADNRVEHQQLIRRAGVEGTVLLKNEGILPLDGNTKAKIAIIGPNAKVAQIMGGGSAQLNPHYSVTPWQGLVNHLGESRLTYAMGCTNYRWEPLWKHALKVSFFANRELTGTPVHSEHMNEGVAFWFPPFAANTVSPKAFSARIVSDFTVDQTGTHNIGFHCAGLAKVFLDDELIIDLHTHWRKGRTFFEEGCDEQVAAVLLKAGTEYRLTIEFANRESDNLVISGWRLGISKPLGDFEIHEAVTTASDADIAILFVGRSGEWDTEGSDLEHLRLPGRQDELVEAVIQANPNTIVVLQTGGPIEMPWIEQVPAVLQAWYPGQECGNAIYDVLFGQQEPSGRLAQTFPRRLDDNPTATDDPRVYPGLNGRVIYREALNIGYRHYDASGISPLFPFGFGLGYTQFAMSDLMLERLSDNAVQLSLSIQNIGDRAGAAVIQIYISELNPRVTRPVKELKQFRKLQLTVGEVQRVDMQLGIRDFAYCDIDAAGWRINAGAFRVHAGFSSEDISVSADIDLNDQFTGY